MKYKKTVLPNGVRVITVPMSDNPTVTFMMYVGTGALFEDAEKAGISHFLEHMCFKGTPTRPGPRRISEELDSIGAQSNAFTWLDRTCYYAKAEARHFKKIADVISDIYLNSIFPEDEMKKEKGVVLGEIDMYSDNPQAKVDDLLQELMYKGYPAERPTIGFKSTVSAITREDLVAYRDSQYKAENTIIVIAGGVPEAEMLDTASAIGARVPKGVVSPEKVTKDKVQERPELTVFKKDTDQAHIIVAFRSFDRFDPDVYIARMIRGILRSGMSSRLFVRLREEMGSGYYVSADHTPFRYYGQFSVSTGTEPKRVIEIVKAILDELNKLKNVLVGKEELEKVREIVRSGMKMGLEASDDIAGFYGDQEVAKGEVKTPEEIDAIYSAITAEDIQRVAQRIFTENRLNMSIVGPLERTPELEQALTFKI